MRKVHNLSLWIPVLLALLAVGAVTWSFQVQQSQHDDAVHDQIETEIPSKIERNRLTISHHLSQMVLLGMDQFTHGKTEDLQLTIQRVCEGILKSVHGLYPQVLSVRFYDTRFSPLANAVQIRDSKSPSPLESALLTAFMGASYREGLWLSAGEIHYRVIVPLIRAQHRLGLVEIVFHPQILLSGFGSYFPGRWYWDIRREGGTQTAQPHMPNPDKAMLFDLDSIVSVAIGAALFSQEGCRVIYLPPSLTVTQAVKIETVILWATAGILFFFSFLLLWRWTRSYSTQLFGAAEAHRLRTETLSHELDKSQQAEQKLRAQRDHLEEIIAQGMDELAVAQPDVGEVDIRFQTIAAALQDALITLDEAGCVTYWSPSAERMFGFSKQKAQSQSLFILLGIQAVLAGTMRSLRSLSDPGGLGSGGNIFEVDAFHENGQIVPVEISISSTRRNDQVTAVVVMRDISSRQAGERELRILSMAVEQSNLAVLVTDAQGAIQYVNRKFCQLSGYEREEVIGKNPRILKSQATPASVYTDLWRTLSTGQPWSGEFYNRRKDGSLFWDATFIAPVKDEAGNTLHYLAVKEDVSERKRLESELVATKEAAEAANLAKSHFLANMSHEIRTPMNAIIGMTNLAMKTEIGTEQSEYLKSVLIAADNLLAVLNDILDLSKIEAGKFRLDPTPFALRQQLDFWMSIMAGEACTKNLELLVDIEGDVPEFMIGDFIRLGQILFNLVGNAIKFTQAGEVIVCIEVARMLDGNRSVELHFSVNDTGMGVAPDKQREIFDKFSQVDETVTRRFGGSGLGLAICAELVAMMQGRIWVESPSNRVHGASVHGPGSTFHFTVMLGRQDDKENQLDDLALNGLFKTVVLCLENQMRIMVMKKWCEESGLEVRVAGRLTEAVVWLQDTPSCLLFVDSKQIDHYRDEWLSAWTQPLVLGSDRVVIFRELSSSIASELPPGTNFKVANMPVSKTVLLEKLNVFFGPKHATHLLFPQDRHPQLSSKSARILVVEDNVLNQKLIRRILEKEKHQVTIADNGSLAIDLTKKEPFDLVLMDIQMPEMDGVSATRKLRETGYRQPIIALTAHALKGDRERFLQAGMDDYLCKPIRQEELFLVLERFLGKSN